MVKNCSYKIDYVETFTECEKLACVRLDYLHLEIR